MFGYENKDKVLNGVNFSIKAGETVALVAFIGSRENNDYEFTPSFL